MKWLSSTRVYRQTSYKGKNFCLKLSLWKHKIFLNILGADYDFLIKFRLYRCWINVRERTKTSTFTYFNLQVQSCTNAFTNQKLPSFSFWIEDNEKFFIDYMKNTVVRKYDKPHLKPPNAMKCFKDRYKYDYLKTSIKFDGEKINICSFPLIDFMIIINFCFFKKQFSFTDLFI